MATRAYKNGLVPIGYPPASVVGLDGEKISGIIERKTFKELLG